MNYEKKYNKTLEQAEKELATCGSMDCDAARLIFRLFPQLHESEDEEIREKVKKCIIYDCSLTQEETDEMLAWPERQKEPKPAEWSEEDEKDITLIICILDDCYAFGRHDLSKTDHENLVKTLKSLRPHWKPSEKQMETLLNIEGDLRAFQYNDKAKIIAELYEQLKRL